MRASKQSKALGTQTYLRGIVFYLITSLLLLSFHLGAQTIDSALPFLLTTPIASKAFHIDRWTTRSTLFWIKAAAMDQNDLQCAEYYLFGPAQGDKACTRIVQEMTTPFWRGATPAVLFARQRHNMEPKIPKLNGEGAFASVLTEEPYSSAMTFFHYSDYVAKLTFSRELFQCLEATTKSLNLIADKDPVQLPLRVVENAIECYLAREHTNDVSLISTEYLLLYGFACLTDADSRHLRKKLVDAWNKSPYLFQTTDEMLYLLSMIPKNYSQKWMEGWQQLAERTKEGGVLRDPQLSFCKGYFLFKPPWYVPRLAATLELWPPNSDVFETLKEATDQPLGLRLTLFGVRFLSPDGSRNFYPPLIRHASALSEHIPVLKEILEQASDMVQRDNDIIQTPQTATWWWNAN